MTVQADAVQPSITRWVEHRTNTAIVHTLAAAGRIAGPRLARPMLDELRAEIRGEFMDLARDYLEVVELLSTGDVTVNGVALSRIGGDS